jgi:hypothetical protein
MLRIACVFLSEAAFPLRDQRTMNTGFAVVRDALIELDLSIEVSLGPALLETGDLGEAIQEAADRQSLLYPLLFLTRSPTIKLFRLGGQPGEAQTNNRNPPTRFTA